MERPIVFMHGSGDSARIWEPQLAYFGERAVAIDLPGHGSRADTLPEQASVQDYARAVHAILTEELRLEQPVIAGHSLGGAIAMELGLEYGDEIGGLILIGTGARLRVMPALLEAARGRPEEASKELKAFCLSPAAGPELLDRLVQEQDARGLQSLYRDLTACDAFDIMGRVGELRMRTLIMCGADERTTPVKYSEYLRAHIAGAMLCIVADAAHYVALERPEEVNRQIDEWVKSQGLDK